MPDTKISALSTYSLPGQDPTMLWVPLVSENDAGVTYRAHVEDFINATVGTSTGHNLLQPPLSAYSPLRPDASGFFASPSPTPFATTWQWGNQGSATLTSHYGGATLATISETANRRCRWVATPSSGAVDFDTYALISTYIPATATSGRAGIIFLDGGTIATPTAMKAFGVQWDNAGTLYRVKNEAATSYTAAWSGGTLFAIGRQNHATLFLRGSYVQSTKVMTWYISWDGCYWINTSTTTTLAADPAYAGIFVDSNGSANAVSMFVRAFVMRSDAAGKTGTMGA